MSDVKGNKVGRKTFIARGHTQNLRIEKKKTRYQTTYYTYLKLRIRE